MESIDRLREYVKEHASSEWAYATAPPKYPLVNCADVDLLEIADAIEREVKANRVDAYTKGYDAGFASADDWAAQHEDAMAEHGWVRLPLDTDGVPIRVGDVMEGWGSFEYHDLMDQPVESMVLHDRNRWEVCCDYVSTWEPSRLRHHHAPTVEDVLREFADELWNRYCIGGTSSDCGVRELEAEYAAKLTLRGDE